MKKNIALGITAVALIISCNQNQTKEKVGKPNLEEQINVDPMETEDGIEVQLIEEDENRIEHLLVTPLDSLNLKIDEDPISFSEGEELSDLQQTMYCLQFVRYESGWYNGQRARFSVWRSRNNFPCCVIVNISRNRRIIARQRVTVTNRRMLRLLMGSVNGISQGVSPCR